MKRFEVMPEAEARAWVADHADPLRVAPLRDPSVEAYRFAAGGHYVRTYWLPVLGPTATLTLERLAHAAVSRAATGDDPALVPLALLSAELGVGHQGGRGATIVGAVARLLHFHAATVERDVLRVRLFLPPLTERQLAKIPPHLAEQHAAGRGAA